MSHKSKTKEEKMNTIKNIRKSVFETNSSSTHNICIAKDAELIIPKKLKVKFGEFGWEYDILDSTEEKASYLYTALEHLKRREDIEKFKEMLSSEGVKASFEKPIYKIINKGTEREYTDSPNVGYVDHVDQLEPFIDDIFKDMEMLKSFLFSPLSYIITGNDNSGHDVTILAEYPHYEYFKGN